MSGYDRIAKAISFIRELVRKSNGEYLDIVQFCSTEDAMAIIEKEKGVNRMPCFLCSHGYGING